MTCAFVFPGQGAQKIGMGAAIINGFRCGMDVITEIEDAISFKISEVISDGCIEELTKSENAQISIFAISMAIVSVLEKEFGYDVQKNVKYVAGHSLGEYSALCTAGVVSLSDAAKIVRFRGKVMSSSCSGESKFLMAAVLGLGVDIVEKIVEPYQSVDNICVVANDNSPKQVVVSGHCDAVNIVALEAQRLGAVKVINLNTSGPFHSPLMVSAAVQFDDYLADNFRPLAAKIPIIMNSTGAPLKTEEDLHSMMVSHMTKRVRWRESMDFLVNESDIEKIVEIGPGRIQSAMLKRTYPDMDICNIETVAQIEDFVA